MKVTIIYDEMGTSYIDIENNEKTISEDLSPFYGEINGVKTYEVDKVEDIDCELIRKRVKKLLKGELNDN
jgi:hypothetical protein